ncbi:MAG: D-glucuronyl C5-epimerase family protein [Deltaproteobacteria bacterium]|nr:D-glucuronyl C5-epimerase family protein [Deltaproteobacteria bacterium]
MFRKRINYLKRVYQAYVSGKDSQLTFWHGTPEVNQEVEPGVLGQYYMPFLAKSGYSAHLDPNGIPLLDYHGTIGLQYNPIAIAQFGLGNYNLFQRTAESNYQEKFLLAADWLKDNLVVNEFGVPVWMHYFDFEYQEGLRSPWYSGLAQGQALSVLVRAYQLTQEQEYLEAAREGFAAFQLSVTEGGVITRDANDHLWIEEYIVSQPTHILNGFIWALWGVYDYYLATNSDEAKRVYEEGLNTIRENLDRYDTGFWSLYDLSELKLKMTASPFYHQLHIIQLRIVHQLTGESVFSEFANRWESYQRIPINRWKAFFEKLLFKVFYY